MAAHNDRRLNSETAEPEFSANQQQEARGWFWWLVWIPVILAVIFWVAGWSFGNYGGPWGPKPSSAPPQISDPAVIIVQMPG